MVVPLLRKRIEERLRSSPTVTIFLKDGMEQNLVRRRKLSGGTHVCHCSLQFYSIEILILDEATSHLDTESQVCKGAEI